MAWVLILGSMFFLGGVAGAAFTSLLYEREYLRVGRREGVTRRISQLDVFELPPSIPPAAPRQTADKK